MSVQKSTRKKAQRSPGLNRLIIEDQLSSMRRGFNNSPPQTEGKTAYCAGVYTSLAKLGRTQEAAEFLQAALGKLRDEDQPVLWQRLGELYEGIGDKKSALGAYIISNVKFTSCSHLFQRTLGKEIQPRIDALRVSIDSSNENSATLISLSHITHCSPF